MTKPKTYDDDQRHPDNVTGAQVVPDTLDNTDIDLTQRGPAHGETHYIPGDGFLVSHGGWSSRSKGSVYDEKKKAILDGRPKSRFAADKAMPDQGTYLSEDEVLRMAAAIHTHRRMSGARGSKEEFFERARAKTHPGTDAVDSAKDGFHKQSDDFDIDKSRSTIFIGLSSVGPPGAVLNGSKVYHHYVVTLALTTPDGRQLCEVQMSPEQFASALFGNHHQPCTVTRYWSMGDDATLLTERVRPPTSIRKRMEARLKGRLQEQTDALNKVVAEMMEQAESGKPARKTQLKDFADRVARAVSHSAANAAFTVDQAREEVTSIMESAAIQFLGQQNLDAKTLWAAAGPALEMKDDPKEQEDD